MPDIVKELDALYGESSYDSPLVRIDEWRIFMDQFVPAASNVRNRQLKAGGLQ